MENALNNVEASQLVKSQIQMQKHKYLDLLEKYQAEFDKLEFMEDVEEREKQEDKLHVKMAQLTDYIKIIDKLLASQYPETHNDGSGPDSEGAPPPKISATITGSGIKTLDQMLSDFANDDKFASNIGLRCICPDDVHEMLKKIHLSGSSPNLDAMIARLGGIEAFVEHVCVLYTQHKRVFFSHASAVEHLRLEHAAKDESPVEPPFALPPVAENETISFEQGIRLMAAAAEEQVVEDDDLDDFEDGELEETTTNSTCISDFETMNDVDITFEHVATPQNKVEALVMRADDYIEVLSKKIVEQPCENRIFPQAQMTGIADAEVIFIDLIEDEAMTEDADANKGDIVPETLSIEVLAQDPAEKEPKDTRVVADTLVNDEQSMAVLDLDSSFELRLSSSDDEVDKNFFMARNLMQSESGKQASAKGTQLLRLANITRKMRMEKFSGEGRCAQNSRKALLYTIYYRLQKNMHDDLASFSNDKIRDAACSIIKEVYSWPYSDRKNTQKFIDSGVCSVRRLFSKTEG